MPRPKLVFANSPLRARAGRRPARSDYRIYATYRRTGSGMFIGELKVVRITDDKLLFPFDGAPVFGPFPVASEARDQARIKGGEIVAADLACPEE